MLVQMLNDESGANLIEYGILVLLIALVAFMAVGFTGVQNSEMWSDIASSLDQ